MALIDNLIKDGWLKSPHIIQAFRNIKRRDFLPKGMEGLEESNRPFPIGFGQTISQPLTVAFMFEQLMPRSGDKVLDIGSGSGWTTALLAEIVGDRGKVIGIEIVPELAGFGRKNVLKYNFIKKGTAEILLGDATFGCPDIKSHPKLSYGFDKILASAAIGWQREKGPLVQDRIPSAWKEQLKTGGRIVVPIESSIWVFDKESEKNFEAVEHPGFAFVPLVSRPDIENGNI